MPKIWRKAIEEELDEKDVELLNILAGERKFSQDEIQNFAKKLKTTTKEVEKKLKTLRDKKILLKDKISIIDQIKIWDGYYIVLVKVHLVPPIISSGVELPTGWRIERYIKKIKDTEKKMKINIVRHAYCLQGTEWDILLITSAKSQEELANFLDLLAKQGWIEKVWSFTPIEFGGQWIFDPVAIPSVKDFKETVRNIKIK